MELRCYLLPQAITSIADLRLFMEHHVFAVWDFMLLLKTLQQHLAPSGAPWVPPTHPEIAGLVNSLVAEEECDLLPENLGGPLHLSHFAIYRRAMVEIDANTAVIDAVLQQASRGDLAGAVRHREIPAPSARFLRTTQELISSGEVHALAAAFAYGRELLVPDLFRGLLDRLTVLELPCPTLRWYLERHIVLDGDSHGPLAERMVLTLAGNDPAARQTVQTVRRQVLADRSAFWDAIERQFRERPPSNRSGGQHSQMLCSGLT
jgi:hypothetical protein